jgi:hypothetical protein
MADSPVVSGDSKEAVAYALLIGIANKQNKLASMSGTPIASADEQWVLETYAKCLSVVYGSAPS